MPKILAITEAMHNYAKNILAKAGEIQSSHGEMERIVNGMTPYFSGALPELLTQRLLDMKKKHEALYEKISQYSAKIDFAADNYDWNDREIASWASRMGVGVAALVGGGTTDGNMPVGSNSTAFGVPGGEFRFVNQSSSEGNEWGIYGDGEGAMWRITGCNIAAFTMALDSLGIETTAGNVCEKNEKILRDANLSISETISDKEGYHPTNMSKAPDLAKAFGTKYLTGSTDTLLDRYIANPGEYSAPVIKINGGLPGEPYHFVVVQGRNADGAYIVVDPANQSIKTYSGEVYSTYQLSK
jgi:uncharacterized protein YukE